MKNSVLFFVIFLSVLLRMRFFLGRFVQKVKTHILCSINCPENRVVNEMMCKIVVEPDRSRMTM